MSGGRLREHDELRDRRDLVEQRDLDRLVLRPGSVAHASSHAAATSGSASLEQPRDDADPADLARRVERATGHDLEDALGTPRRCARAGRPCRGSSATGNDAVGRNEPHRRPVAGDAAEARPGSGSSRPCRCRARRRRARRRRPRRCRRSSRRSCARDPRGCSAGPKCGLFVSAPNANSCVFSLPTIAAPAARSRATHSASRSGTRWRIFDAAVVGMPGDVDHVLDARPPVARAACRAVQERVVRVEGHGAVSGGSRCSSSASAGRMRSRSPARPPDPRRSGARPGRPPRPAAAPARSVRSD